MSRNPHKRRCSATTAAGRPCPNWALRDTDPASGRPLCNVHAGRTGMPAAADRAAGRACTATSADGTPCRRWANRHSLQRYGRPLCNAHVKGGGLPGPQDREAGRQCSATTRQGERCPRWALRDSQELYGRPLCNAHAGRNRLPGPGERRCTATTQAGEQCPLWAMHRSAEEHGRPLCAVHAGVRQHAGRLPQAGEPRCSATTQDGTQCRRWAPLQDDEGHPLCWLHAYPHKHPSIRHGYYMSPPPLGQAGWTAVELARASGRELQGEIVLTRLLIRMILAYLTHSELPLGQNMNSVRLIIRQVRALARLLLASRELDGPLESPEREQRRMRHIAQELAARRQAAEGEDPPRPALTDLEKEALLLLWRAGDRELKWDIGLLRIMLRRVLGYVTDAQGLSVAERVDLLNFLIIGAATVTDLMYRGRSLLPPNEN